MENRSHGMSLASSTKSPANWAEKGICNHAMQLKGCFEPGWGGSDFINNRNTPVKAKPPEMSQRGWMSKASPADLLRFPLRSRSTSHSSSAPQHIPALPEGLQSGHKWNLKSPSPSQGIYSLRIYNFLQAGIGMQGFISSVFSLAMGTP